MSKIFEKLIAEDRIDEALSLELELPEGELDIDDFLKNPRAGKTPGILYSEQSNCADCLCCGSGLCYGIGGGGCCCAIIILLLIFGHGGSLSDCIWDNCCDCF